MDSNATLTSTMTPTNFLQDENGYNQTIIMLYPDGSPFNITMVDLKTMNDDNIVTGIVTGLQLGLATLMLIVTFLLTQKGKRQSLIFYCNIAALALDPIRSAISAIWLLSTWNSPYVYFTHDASRITAGNIAASLIGTPFKILEIMAIQISLMTQVRVVLLTSPPILHRCIIAVLFALALINTGMEIRLAVINGQQIAKMADSLPIQPGLAQAADISLCVFIGCAMFVFLWKLGYALKNQRNLGLVKFGPLQVIFIMGAQTMIIPSKFSLFLFSPTTEAKN
jgi:pheromone alpha factor receptor